MIFVDSSIIIACFSKTDDAHKRVTKLLEKILGEEYEVLVTNTDVISETLNWIAKRCNRQELLATATILLSQEMIRIEDMNHDDWLGALEIINKYHDQKLSFTDAVSFATIARLKIKRLLSLDSDFNLLRGVTNLAV